MGCVGPVDKCVESTDAFVCAEIMSGGELPWSEAAEAEIMSRIRGGARLKAPEGCDKTVYRLMGECWRIAPSSRATASQLLEQLELLMPSDDELAELEWPATETLQALASEAAVRAEAALYGVDLDSSAARAAFAQKTVQRQQISLSRQLGSGAFGTVHLGTVTTSSGAQVRVAVKTLSSSDAEVQSKFLTEARLQCALSHAHIVGLVAVVADGLPYMMGLELMEGGDLQRYLRKQRDSDAVTVGAMVGMGRQIADAMAYLAAHKIVHRDLAARLG